LWGEA